MEIIMVIVLLVFAIFCIVMAVKSQAQIDARKAAYHKTKDYMSYGSKYTLKVTKLDPDNAKVIEIHPYRKTKYGYTPEKLIYTGATVGGITTGGWHKSGGFYAKDQGNSGKARLYYFHESKSGKFIISEIERIELSPELVRQAQSSNIAQYLSGNTIVIRHPTENMDAAVGAMQLGHKDVAFNIVENAKIAASPTFEKSSAIVNWLSSAENPIPQQKSEQSKSVKQKSEVERKSADARARKIKIATMILVPSLIILVVTLVLGRSLFLSSKYKTAISMMDTNVVQAYESLIALGSYKDSVLQAESIYEQYKIEKLKVAQVGDYVSFGNYEQDNNTQNGNEKIEWLVLAKEDNKILVISRYGLDCAQYDRSKNDQTWETSDIRSYLNDSFINRAFSASEQAMIAETSVSADKNPQFNTEPGHDTQDKVFLLSILEAEKYFSSDDDRKCLPTDYAVAQGVFTGHGYSSGGKATCTWWLRSPGDRQDYAARVLGNGNIHEDGVWFHDDGTIRPAIWINLG